LLPPPGADNSRPVTDLERPENTDLHAAILRGRRARE
jgi:hypothetical protein